MGKFGLVTTDRDRAIELMFGENKNAAETSRILAEEGMSISPPTLRNLKSKQFEALAKEQRQEAMAGFMLESVKKVIIKFEDLYEQFERLAKKLETQGDTFQQIIVLKELNKMINTSLRKLGEYKNGLERIQVQNLNVINSADMISAIEQMQTGLFSMDAEIKDGKMILNNPSPELIDSYHQWKFRQGKSINANDAEARVL